MNKTHFSHVISPDILGPKEKSYDITASSQAREELALLLDVDRIRTFEAHVTLKRLNAHRIEARYEAHAALEQTCVVSFNRVKAAHELAFRRIFDAKLDQDPENGEIDLDYEDPELLEPIENNAIDLCHPLVEELSLAIDPFPKAQETSFEPQGFGPEITETETQENNPFAVLARLKEKK